MKKLIFSYLILFAFLGCYAQEEEAESNTEPTSAAEVDEEGALNAFRAGKSKFGQKRYKEAIEDFKNALGLNPNLIEAYIERGGVLFLLQDFTGAITDYDQAVDMTQTKIDQLNNEGEIKRILEDTRGATLAFAEASKLKPQLAKAYYKRGSLKRFLADKQGSCDDLMKAMELGNGRAITVLKKYCGYETKKSSTPAPTNTPKGKKPSNNEPGEKPGKTN